MEPVFADWMNKVAPWARFIHPYPLSEKYFLCSYDAGNELRKGGGNYGLYLVDCFGNKELIYRDPQIACMSPIPLRATPTPPASPAALIVDARRDEDRPSPP